MRGTWQGSGAWQTSRGPDLRGLFGVAALVGLIYAVAEIILKLIWWIVAIGSTLILLAAAGGIAWLVHWARQDRRRQSVGAGPVYQLPPEPRPQLESYRNPAIEPGSEIHLHFHGLTPDQIAAILSRRGPYLEEDQ